MKKYLSAGAFAAAVLFGIMGLWLPPQGEIDGSVLILIAQLLVFCATLLGIRDYADIIRTPHRPAPRREDI